MAVQGYTVFLLLLLLTIASAENLRIGAFNVQIFGQTKAGKPDVMATLADIIQRYDILLIQEIRDKAGTALPQLVDQTNDLGLAQYDFVVSERLGRSTSKEQYAFIFKKNAGITKLDIYQYPDPNEAFGRPPYAVRFGSTRTVVDEFILAGVHITPDEAKEEINALVPVHDAILTKWKNDNIVIMGDFNADCSYLSQKASAELDLREDGFHWLIDDSADTTTSSTNCAYDRFVLTGEEFFENVATDSAEVFRFDLKYGLDEEQTKAVSDHYPIEFELTPGDEVSPVGSGGDSIYHSSWMNVLALLREKLEL